MISLKDFLEDIIRPNMSDAEFVKKYRNHTLIDNWGFLCNLGAKDLITRLGMNHQEYTPESITAHDRKGIVTAVFKPAQKFYPINLPKDFVENNFLTQVSFHTALGYKPNHDRTFLEIIDEALATLGCRKYKLACFPCIKVYTPKDRTRVVYHSEEFRPHLEKALEQAEQNHTKTIGEEE